MMYLSCSQQWSTIHKDVTSLFSLMNIMFIYLYYIHTMDVCDVTLTGVIICCSEQIQLKQKTIQLNRTNC